MRFDRNAFDETLSRARARLLSSRAPAGHWEGELSSSALSTAAAVFALATVDAPAHEVLIRGGLKWLAEHRNPDGGWGDTVISKSNLPTTVLCWSAFSSAGYPADHDRDTLAAAEAWVLRHVGARPSRGSGSKAASADGLLEPESLAQAVVDGYGQDRTFSAPILTMCALAGTLGGGRRGWRWVPPLPFELAAFPRRWLKWLRLPAVSYALPALIAVGQARYHHCPPRNPFTRLLRRLARPGTLRTLEHIQPAGGGFLEAAPLTAFVVMSLAACGRRDHPVIARGVEFLVRSVRADGSWPIDTNLATWVTTLSVNALGAGCDCQEHLSRTERETIRRWLLGQQHRQEHPYTRAAPGGWAWTDLPGGVPDADDTAGSLLALRNLGPVDGAAVEAATAGVQWLLRLQNRDGGIPTFCRGWKALPFDRSSPDLTAHALRGLLAWLADAPPPMRRRMQRAIGRAVAYLRASQRLDGSWLPLWFGNQSAPAQENPTYGTARVLIALQDLAADRRWPGVGLMIVAAAEWLLAAQSGDGGWGGARSVPPSVEETALAVDALAAVLACPPAAQEVSSDTLESAVAAGVSWLIEHTRKGERIEPAPIGLYFAKLWYFERLYPLIFAVSALERVRKLLGLKPAPDSP